MGITISGNGIVEGNLANGAVTNTKLAAGIDATKLADGTITNSELQYINSLSSNAQTQIDGAGVDGINSLANADAIVISSKEEVTMPLQPCFHAYVTSEQSNVTGDGTVYNITGAFWTERYDIGGNFSNGTFTAPITGKYLIAMQITVQGMTTNNNNFSTELITSNNTYAFGYDWAFQGRDHSMLGTTAMVVDMDASDTAYLSVYVYDTDKFVDIKHGSRWTNMSGYLLG